MKKLIMLIAGGILSAALPLAADEWADPETGITWKYSLADGVATVKGTTMSPDEYKAVESLAVPDTFDGAPVTSIGGDAFAWYYSLKEITIPETVTNIGGYAFRYCTNLVSFAFPPNLERIGDGAFANTDIGPDLVVPDSVTHIGDCAFSGCRNLKRVTLPVAAINAAYASGGFSDKFFEVAVKDRTPVIEELTITGEGDIVNYASSVYGELAGTLKKLVLSSGITRVGAWAFYEFKELEEIVFPETLLSIGGSAFESCEKLPSVTLPESLLDLGGESFMRCYALTEFVVPNNVTNVGSQALRECWRLKKVVFGDGCKSIEGEVFSSGNSASPVENVTIPAGLERVTDWGDPGAKITSGKISNVTISGSGDMKLRLCQIFLYPNVITNLVIGEGVTSLPDNAFLNDNKWENYGGPHLKDMYIPSTLSRFGENACNGGSIEAVHITDLAAWCAIDFATEASNPLSCGASLCLNGASVTDLEVPAGVTDILQYTFYRSQLASVVVPDGTRSIGNRSFAYSYNLRKATLPASLTSIHECAFLGCPLEEVTIPVGVTEIGKGAFEDCSSLANINFAGDAPPTVGEGSFAYVSEGCTVTVPDTAAWRAAADADGKWNGLTVVYSATHGPDPTPEPVPTPPGVIPYLYSSVSGAANLGLASVWDGWIEDGKGVAGTVLVKVGKFNGKKPAKVTANVVLAATGKKLAFKGEMAADGKSATLTCKGQSDLTLSFGERALAGAWNGGNIIGGRNLLLSKDKAEVAAANNILAPWKGAVNAVWGGGTVSATIANKGKTKVTVILANGTKAMANGQFIIGEEWCAIPVTVNKKMNLAFLVWLPKTGGSVVVEGLGGGVAAGAPKPKDALAFTLDGGFGGIEGLQAALLPTKGYAFGGGAKWTFKAADTVKLNAEKTAAEVAKDNGNPSGLKLMYKAKDGSFKGKFTVYAVQGGKLKKLTANVTGVMVGATGYGTATIRGIGYASVTIE